MARLDDFGEAARAHDLADGHGRKIGVRCHPYAHGGIDRKIFYASERLAVLEFRQWRFRELKIARREKTFGARVQNELAISGWHDRLPSDFP